MANSVQDKAEYLSTMWTEYEGMFDFASLFDDWQLVFPYCVLLSMGELDYSPMGDGLVNDLWADTCLRLSMDPDFEYLDSEGRPSGDAFVTAYYKGKM